MKSAVTTIRKMTPADVPSVANIARSTMPYAWSEEVFHDCLKADYQAWILVNERGEVTDMLGFAIVLVQGNECQLMNICIKPDQQGKGFGRQLLQHITDYCKQQRVSRIILEVRRSNGAAISIYKAHGFSLVGERKFYYPAHNGREDALVLILEVK